MSKMKTQKIRGVAENFDEWNKKIFFLQNLDQKNARAKNSQKDCAVVVAQADEQRLTGLAGRVLIH